MVITVTVLSVHCTHTHVHTHARALHTHTHVSGGSTEVSRVRSRGQMCCLLPLRPPLRFYGLAAAWFRALLLGAGSDRGWGRATWRGWEKPAALYNWRRSQLQLRSEEMSSALSHPELLRHQQVPSEAGRHPSSLSHRHYLYVIV